MHAPQPDIISAEVCERLGIDRSTLTRWVRRGLITPTYKFPHRNGAMLFDPVDVERLAADRVLAGVAS